jgi:HK97 gp10 family phage protein
MFRMKLVGARELEANLMALPELLAKRTLARALMKVAQPIADEARTRSPQNFGKNMRKIVVAATLSRRQRKGTRKVPGVRTVYIGVRPSPVAHLIEFGTGPRYHRSGKSTGVMPAQPFLRPAWDNGKFKALEDFGVILGRELEKSAARLAKRNSKKAMRR